MAKEISALELRKHFGEIMDEVRYRKEPFIVSRNGRPVLVLLDIDAYRSSLQKEKDSVFIEDYTQERISEFLKEDEVDASSRTRFKQSLESA